MAVTRAMAGRPTVPSGDAEAEDRLVQSLRLPLPLRWRPPGMGPYIASRTEFYDGVLLRACDSGTRQVVVVAAGYDARALRFRQPGVQFFELDHPGTQDDKVARLTTLGIEVGDVRFVPVDLGHDSVADALARAGHDQVGPTHFMCEGLTPYLPMPVLVRLLRSLASRAGPGSTLATDFAGASADGDVLARVRLHLVQGGTAALGERMVTMRTAPEAASLLRETGWTDVTFTPTAPSLPVAFASASASASPG